ncbi:hypothetical protein NEOLEDRAFT_534771 [Neolentinus lepideus HHB14362 ss-1]|uniref:Uncharacterized protein n=1 Tax=Neolentinus lepideus HHB14362 ss-1 TaxID=1314782 RepID=A0A165RAD3_9AGAM|nr:hypothetical protein NEOLEDRAFT_534771 [Neolentinus lepideus HHB14362 ss-1]
MEICGAQVRIARNQPLVHLRPRHPPLAKAEDINTSVAIIYSFVSGAKTMLNPHSIFNNYVDVRDVAFAHIQAVVLPEAANQCFATVDGAYNLVPATIKKNFPQHTSFQRREGTRRITTPRLRLTITSRAMSWALTTAPWRRALWTRSSRSSSSFELCACVGQLAIP